jgi:small subunit ribosomal protein S1
MTDETPPADPTSPSNPDPANPDADRDDDSASPEFARALEAFERGRGTAAAAAGAAAEIAVGMKVRGTVIAVGGEHALIDFGGRSEALAEMTHFRAEDGTPTIAAGQVLELFVVEAGDQIVLAPSIRAEAHAALRQLRAAHAAGVPVSGRVTGLNAGGLAVDLGGARGFCPLSQIEAGFCADPSVYVGRTLEFAVTGVEEGRGGAVLSRRQLLRHAEEERAKQLLASLKPGDELEGTVARLEAFGAFVDLGGVDGLVHVSEIRHERTAHPDQVLHAGDRVRVRVLRLGTDARGRTRIALSMRAAMPDPWEGVEARIAPGARVQGTVTSLADFGAFVALAPGIEGLVHVSEVASRRIAHAKEALVAGQSVEVLVLAVDPAKKRISLSIRQALAPEMPAPGAELPGPRAGASRPEPGRGRAGPARDAPVPGAGMPPPPAASPAAEPEMTTMAIALRKALEHSRKKQAGGEPS